MNAEPIAPFTPVQLAELFPARRVPTRPTLMPIDGSAEVVFPTLAHLAQALAERLGPERRPVLIRSMGTMIGYDTFPILSVHGENVRGLAGRPCTASWVCAVAVQDTSAEALDAAITAAQRRLTGRAAA